MIKEIQQSIIKWGMENYCYYPWRSTKNLFWALIAEMMLQRTKAEQVIPVYKNFTNQYFSPSEINFEESDRMFFILQPLGLRWRNKNILNLCIELSKRKGVIPETKKELLILPGVGDYIANAFLSLHRNVREPIIDSNVVRFWGRVFGLEINKSTRREKSFIELVEKLTPDKNFKEFNYGVLDFSRMICKQQPLCSKCRLKGFCKHVN